MKRKNHPTEQTKRTKKTTAETALVLHEQQTTSDWESFSEAGYQNFVIKNQTINPITGLSLAKKLLHTLINMQLMTVRLEGCKIGAESMPFLVRGFNQNFGIHELSLKGSILDSRGFKAFTKTLSTVSSLTTLNLSGIGLADGTAKQLSKAIGKLELRKIILSNNSIKDDGAKALAKYAPSSLTTIDLRKNKIGDTGVKILTSKLKTLSKLEEVWLGENQIDQEGALSLSDLFTLPKLSLLNLQNNPFSLNEKASMLLLEVFDKQQTAKSAVRPVLKENLSLFPSAPLTLIEEYTEGGHHQNFNFFPKVILTKEEAARDALLIEKIIEATENQMAPDEFLSMLADILGTGKTAPQIPAITTQIPAITTTDSTGEVDVDYFDMSSLMGSLAEIPTVDLFNIS